jgi:hypothetical protein
LFDANFSAKKGVARESQWDSGAYDTGFLSALATVKASKDLADPSQVTGAAIRDALFTLNDPAGQVIRPGSSEFAKAARAIAAGQAINYEGASGPCDFNAYGRALNRISHWRANAGQVTDLAVYDCVADASCPKR